MPCLVISAVIHPLYGPTLDMWESSNEWKLCAHLQVTDEAGAALEALPGSLQDLRLTRRCTDCGEAPARVLGALHGDLGVSIACPSLFSRCRASISRQSVLCSPAKLVVYGAPVQWFAISLPKCEVQPVSLSDVCAMFDASIASAIVLGITS